MIELGKIKSDLTFFEHHNLNTNFKSSEHHIKVKQSRDSIRKIEQLLKSSISDNDELSLSKRNHQFHDDECRGNQWN